MGTSLSCIRHCIHIINFKVVERLKKVDESILKVCNLLRYVKAIVE